MYREILKPQPELDIRVITVWVPVLESDTYETAKRGPPEMPDPRVIHCYDKGGHTSRWFLANVVSHWPLKDKPVFRKGLIWDAFFLYGPEAAWSELATSCQAAGATILNDRSILVKALLTPVP